MLCPGRKKALSSDAEALYTPIDMAVTDVNVCTDSLHRLHCQATTQVLNVSTTGW